MGILAFLLRIWVALSFPYEGCLTFVRSRVFVRFSAPLCRFVFPIAQRSRCIFLGGLESIRFLPPQFFGVVSQAARYLSACIRRTPLRVASAVSFQLWPLFRLLVTDDWRSLATLRKLLLSKCRFSASARSLASIAVRFVYVTYRKRRSF